MELRSGHRQLKVLLLLLGRYPGGRRKEAFVILCYIMLYYAKVFLIFRSMILSDQYLHTSFVSNKTNNISYCLIYIHYGAYDDD